MPTGYIPILQIKTKDGKWLPVNAIGGQVASKVLYNNAYPTVEQALDYLFENGTGGGGSGSTGSELFIVNVQAQSEGDAYTVTSHDKTYAQIDAAYKAGKQVLAVWTEGTDQYLLPLAIKFEESYEFILFDGNLGIIIDADKRDNWTFSLISPDASVVNFSSTLETLPPDINKVSDALDWLIQKAHEHSNKSVIDGLSDSNGVLKYNNSFIMPQKISEGTNITLADNTEYRLTNVTTLNLSYPTGDFECWMRLTFAESGEATVTLPTGTKYIGTTPDFKNGETWELSFKDKVMAAKKVGADDKDAGGENGVTPHIGENGNWYIGNTDTGKPSRGKSAYQYAQDGGYTGTETEFAEKMAEEQLTGTTSELTPTQVYDAVSAGIPVKVQYIDSTYGLLSFTAFNVAESLSTIVSQTIVYYNGVYILAELFGNKSNGIWGFMTTTLAEKKDIPSKLPNPNTITFTGAVTGNYDGSAAMTVNIPSAVTDEHINSLIDTKLGVIENGSY